MQYQLPQALSYKERAEECLRMARLVPAYLKSSYLALADSYERLAKYPSIKPRTDLKDEGGG
jgi:hypothetical protein